MTPVFICTRPARDAVAAGARLLDQLDTEAARHERAVAGWSRYIQRQVDIDSADTCPLGQMYGEFDEAPLFADCDTADEIILRAKVFGFWATATPGQEDDIYDSGNAETLNQRWREEIYDRNRRPTAAWVPAA